MAIRTSGGRDEVNESGYVAGSIAVTTSQVEAKAGADRLSARQEVLIYNDSEILVFFGPSGVTATGVNKGIPLGAGDSTSITLGDIGLFLITEAGSATVIVQEFA